MLQHCRRKPHPVACPCTHIKTHATNLSGGWAKHTHVFGLCKTCIYRDHGCSMPLPSTTDRAECTNESHKRSHAQEPKCMPACHCCCCCCFVAMTVPLPEQSLERCHQRPLPRLLSLHMQPPEADVDQLHTTHHIRPGNARTQTSQTCTNASQGGGARGQGLRGEFGSQGGSAIALGAGKAAQRSSGANLGVPSMIPPCTN